ncbi:hypothetical protein Thiowin_03985 [Thiorhodovibrio winogradskyi]|uniref:Uncharacterized protein n=1 Tax=Thiorhodovibrio winogradskyi TaxID=77007 RepID=A0ABZ0SEF1_9GAMM
MTPIKAPKKLVEVALPLDAINAAAAREKSIRHGINRVLAPFDNLHKTTRPLS